MSNPPHVFQAARPKVRGRHERVRLQPRTHPADASPWPQESPTSQALRSLSYEHRQAIAETLHRGRSVNEAAEVLGVPVQVVKTRVYEALCLLRAALHDPRT